MIWIIMCVSVWYDEYDMYEFVASFNSIQLMQIG